MSTLAIFYQFLESHFINSKPNLDTQEFISDYNASYKFIHSDLNSLHCKEDAFFRHIDKLTLAIKPAPVININSGFRFKYFNVLQTLYKLF